MDSWPLLANPSPELTVAWRGGRPVSAAHFLTDARRIAAQLPGDGPVLNLCRDRYAFATGFAAALIAGRTSLLPSSTAPLALAQLAARSPGLACVTDDEEAPARVPALRLPLDSDGSALPFEVPSIRLSLRAAIVYTSGSTGEPLGHAKTWGALVHCLRTGAERLGLAATPHSIVATVPPQHMYGFELSVLMPWIAGHAPASERPLHAAEVAAAIAAVPAPRMLVTTPVHLRALLASTIELPTLAGIVSATAPLSASLALDCERRWQVPLREIYGSTETGEMASRRTAHESLWTLWPGVRLEPSSEGYVALGGHLAEPVTLQDCVEPIDATLFALHGRRTDLINVAGKRSSLGYLDHQLQSVAGVLDGAFIAREDAALEGSVTRLAALVVAPSLNVADVTAELRRRIDPAFMPRPLLLVDRLPRNAAGKLPRAAVDELLARRVQASRA